MYNQHIYKFKTLLKNNKAAIAITFMLLLSIGILSCNIHSAKKESIREISSLSQILATNIEPFIRQYNKPPAMQTLNSLRVRKDIELICIYDSIGSLFVHYSQAETNNCPSTLINGLTHSINQLTIADNIIKNGRNIGGMYIHSNLDGYKRETIQYIQWFTIFITTIFISLFLAKSQSPTPLNNNLRNL